MHICNTGLHTCEYCRRRGQNAVGLTLEYVPSHPSPSPTPLPPHPPLFSFSYKCLWPYSWVSSTPNPRPTNLFLVSSALHPSVQTPFSFLHNRWRQRRRNTHLTRSTYFFRMSVFFRNVYFCILTDAAVFAASVTVVYLFTFKRSYY